MRIFTKVILKQSWSYESNRGILVDFIGVSAVKRKAVSDGLSSRTGRAQSSSLKLGGNTDIAVRPKLIIVQLRAFLLRPVWVQYAKKGEVQ